jgi:hypothetical protein
MAKSVAWMCRITRESKHCASSARTGEGSSRQASETPHGQSELGLRDSQLDYKFRLGLRIAFFFFLLSLLPFRPRRSQRVALVATG